MNKLEIMKARRKEAERRKIAQRQSKALWEMEAKWYEQRKARLDRELRLIELTRKAHATPTSNLFNFNWAAIWR